MKDENILIGATEKKSVNGTAETLLGFVIGVGVLLGAASFVDNATIYASLCGAVAAMYGVFVTGKTIKDKLNEKVKGNI